MTTSCWKFSNALLLLAALSLEMRTVAALPVQYVINHGHEECLYDLVKAE